MKKFLSVLALSSMLVGLGACSSEENGSEIEEIHTNGRVFIKLDNVAGPSSRMTENPKTESDITEFHNGFIIFGTPKSAIRKHYEIVTDASQADQTDHTVLLDDLRKGKTFEGVPGDVTNVAIVANVSEEELSAAEFHNGTIRFHTDVLNKVIYLKNQYADNMSHVALYDMKQLTSTGKGMMGAALEMKPMCARIEIDKITPGPDVVEYTIEGIGLAGFYDRMAISQLSNRDYWTAPDYDAADPAVELHEFFNSWPYLVNYDIRGVESTVGEGASAKKVTTFYPTEEGKSWVYPFFAKSEIREDNEHYGLRLIVKVSNLKVYLKNEDGDKQLVDVTKRDKENGVSDEKAGIRYLNINGFVEDYHNTQSAAIQFYNGYVYKVQSFEITTQNLSDKIMPADMNVNISVSVKPWVIKKIYPQI